MYLGLALKNHLVFGKDFIQDYGPLGFLATRLTVGTSPYWMFLFDLFVLVNLTFVLYTIFSRTELNVSIRLVFAVLIVQYSMSRSCRMTTFRSGAIINHVGAPAYQRIASGPHSKHSKNDVTPAIAVRAVR